ncbi:MAG: hypothetical protein ABJQ78_07065 [Alloalcanivorax sp.]
MIKDTAQQILDEAKAARSLLSKTKPILVGNVESAPASLYLRNYAGCILNRHIDIYDDTIFLLENDRYQAACTVSRAMIETYAFGKYLYSKLHDALVKDESVAANEAVLELILKFINSSRYKVGEQEKLKKGTFSLEDYSFTPQAIERMSMGLAGSEHVMNALRKLYKEEKAHLSSDESRFEQTYDILSEWVHPSQTSVFHHYVEETHQIPTSVGFVNLFDSAALQCALAIHFIADAENQYECAMRIADEMERRASES